MEKRELPEGWESIHLGEAEKAGELIFQNGFACGCNNQDGRGIPQLRPMNVNNLGQIDLTALKFIEVDRNISNYTLQKNDVVINNTNSSELVGKTAFWKGGSGNYVLSNHMTIIRIFKQSNIDPKFLSRYFHYLWTKRFFKNICQDHINQSSVSLERLREIEIPLPPLPVQSRIVEILERVDALRFLRTQADAETQKLLQSVFYKMFGDPVRNEKGWEVESIGNVTTHVSSGATPRGGAEVYEKSGIEFIRSQNVHMNRLICDDIAFIPENIHQNMKRSWVKNGDVLFNITGASIGRVAWYKGKDNSANVNQHVCIIRPIKEKLLPEFLSYQMSFPSYQNKIFINQSGATRQAFNYAQITNFLVILPPIALQRRFSHIVRKEEQMRENQSESNQYIERVFDGLMTKAFTGSLI